MNTEKRQVLETMLKTGVVLVHLDTTRHGVDLPEHARREQVVGLHLSWTFEGDMRIDDAGVRANLSFQRQRYACVLPWSSLFAVRQLCDGKTAIFLDDAPAEVRAELAAAAPQPVKKRPDLRLVS